MKLFLTSSGISGDLTEPFLNELQSRLSKTGRKDLSEIVFYFIPTAADGETSGSFKYVVQGVDDFAAIGINPIWYNIRYKTEKEIEEDLSKADVIWVNGGNTFYLLKFARESGFLRIVQDLVKNKGVIYGGTSAGSILASTSISSAGWKVQADSNDVGIVDLSALGFIPEIPFVHYESTHDTEIQKAKRAGETVWAIPNGSMVVVTNEEREIIGPIQIFG